MNVIVMLADKLFHDPLRPGGQLTSYPILLQLQDSEGSIWLRPEAALGISNALFRQAEEYRWTCGLSMTRSVGPGCDMFLALARVGGARIQGRFGLSGECRPKEAVRLREWNRVGGELRAGIRSGHLESIE